VRGRFLAYWLANGGLFQQGFPISEELREWSDVDGKMYTVQYFERAVFELHPENKEPYDVLLSLLGVARYRQLYPSGAPGQTPNTSPGATRFAQTGKTLGGRFLENWKANGGLAQQGFPISDPFQERNIATGKTYTVQYFERAVFEWHPENRPPHDVLLSHLGAFRYREKYCATDSGECGAQSTRTPTISVPTPSPTRTVAITGQASVEIVDYEFKPAMITVTVGTQVVWTHLDYAPHNTDHKGRAWTSPVMSRGAHFAHVFGEPGAYDYHCTLHPDMQGVIKVIP
jgi:plastocyanin